FIFTHRILRRSTKTAHAVPTIWIFSNGNSHTTQASLRIFNTPPRQELSLWQRPHKSLHQAPDSATRPLSACTGFSKPDLKSLPNRAFVSVRILHIFRIFCSPPISGSLLQRRICYGASPFLGKAGNPLSSAHVAAW